jgi:hypothetical protein
LISIVDKDDSQVIQFSHFSVKEFLMSSRVTGSRAEVSRFHIILEQAHTIFAKVCLGVLLRLDEHADWHNVKNKFPLARYAAKHWIDHVKFEQVSSHLREAIEEFLTRQIHLLRRGPVSMTWMMEVFLFSCFLLRPAGDSPQLPCIMRHTADFMTW